MVRGALSVLAVVSLVTSDTPAPTAPTIAIAPPHRDIAFAITPPPPLVDDRMPVRVTDDDAPVADAFVVISDGARATTVATDREGVAHVPRVAGPIELYAYRDGRVSRLVRVDGPAERLAVALERAGNVRGKILVEGTLPAEATVELVPLDIDHATRTATIARDGSFAIDGLPRGRWRVEPHAAGFVALAEQSLDARREIDQVAIRLERAGSITGSVVDATGAPVRDARIVLRLQGGLTTHAFEPAHVPSTLRWIHPLAGARQMPVREAARYGAPRPGSRAAECGQGHCGVDIGSQRGAIIHAAADGIVIGAWNELRGEAGRMVAIDHGGGLHTMYMHLEQARSLEPGQRIHAGDPIGTLGSTGFALDNPHLHFALTQERDGRTWYLDPEPILRRAVVLPAPRSLDDAEPSPRADAAIDVAPATGAHELVTDAAGQFRIDNVEPGTYVAVAFADALAPNASTSFTVRGGGETAGVRIALGPGAIVRGRVVGPAGAIADATVTVAVGFGETANKIATTHTDRTGEFTLRALTGKVTLTATAPGFGDVEHVVALEGTTERRENFTLVIEDAQVRGQILGADGASPGPVAIRVVEGTTRRSATSDPSGRFSLDRIARGAYTIELTSPRYPPLRARVVSGDWANLRFEPAARARITLRDAWTRTPMSGLRVECVGPNHTTIDRLTDASGELELTNLAAGTWTFTARAPGFTTAKQTLAIAIGQLNATTLELARSAIIEGVVRDRFGRRVAGARVTLGEAVAQSDQDGMFRLADAPAGNGIVHAEHDGDTGTFAIELRPGEERRSLAIEIGDR